MKSVKLISLAITLLISLLTFGQENDSIQNKKPKGFHCESLIKKNNEVLIIIDGSLATKEVLAKN